MLETGNRHHAAQRAYRAHGFHERGAFGAYRPDRRGIFMGKELAK
jgi:ribosomal protein S18 acetylase RimI-like enzyme